MPTLNEFYPVSIGTSFEVEAIDRVIHDNFEAGVITRRSLWPEAHFRRQFKISHANALHIEEQSILSLWSRAGRKASFWFRDNVSREGNHEVVFQATPKRGWQSGQKSVQSEMTEVAVRRALPTLADIAAACGGTYPIAWVDPNRETYSPNPTGTLTEPMAYDVAQGKAWLAWQSGAFNPSFTIYSAYQTHILTGNWARSEAVSGIGTGTPACTVFIIASAAAAASGFHQCMVALGSDGSGASLGIALYDDNRWAPYQGFDGSMAGASFLNSPASTPRSFAAVHTTAGNTVTFYANGTSQGTATTSRNLPANPLLSLGASPGGNYPANTALYHAIIIPKACSQTEIRAIHNLLAYQTGMATV